MISHTAAQLARLKDKPSINHLVQFQIGDTWYYLTDADIPIDYAGATYVPGYLDSEQIGDIEVTSEPKTNDISIDTQAHENTFVGLLLSGDWMNKPLTIYKHIWDEQGAILTKNAFQGLLSDYELTEENNVASLVVSSIWADFEKTASIRTNPVSQQRYYPGDRAFEWAVQAMKKVYWGKANPNGNDTVGYGDTIIQPPGWEDRVEP